MEQGYRKETVFEKQKRLLSIVESVYNLDLTKNSRKRDYVSARISYCHILRDVGLGFVYIGKTVNKHYSTMIHNVKSFDTYMRFDERFEEFHSRIVDKFERGSVDYFDVKQLELESQVNLLNLRIKELDSQNANLISKLESIEEYNKKNESMHRLINQKVTPETENEIEFKLNRFFNGL